jgi:ABC-type uncharacterized transport system permease subunit
MKNRIIVGVVVILSGVLVAVGPHSLFPVCDQSHHATTSNCYWTGQASIGIGIVMVLLGIAYIFLANEQARAGVSIGVAASFLLLFLLANVFIGMSDMETMRCRTTTLPILNTISVLGFVLASVNVGYLLRRRPTPSDTKAASVTV